MANPRSAFNGRELILPLSAAALYVALRLAGWLNGPELEGHDSVRYLGWAETFRSFDLGAIIAMSPDAAPLFPLLTALVSFVTGDLEAAARVVSLLSSVATLAAVYVIGRRIGSKVCALSGIVLLAFVSPDFHRMSYSVMSDPLYIALFSWSAAVLLATMENPGWRSGVTLGVLSALAFLTRVEGILLMAALPLLHLIYARTGARRLPLVPVATANLVLVLVMAAIIAPQILRVSSLMNTFSLNGRSVWPALLASPDGKSYDEKLTGLDYHPKVLNLHYLQTHPEAVRDLVAATGHAVMFKAHTATVIRNVRLLHDRQLVTLVGLPVLAFSVVGFLTLLRSGRGADALLMASFMGIALAGPLIYEVTLRHLLVLVPFLCVLAARGLEETSQVAAESLFARPAVAKYVLGALLVIVAAMPLERIAGLVLKPDDVNGEYSATALREPATMIRDFSRGAGRQASIITRKTYLAYFSGSSSHIAPYTDLAGLLTYIEDLQPDFLFYEEPHLRGYPFVDEIGSDFWLRHFREVWTSSDGHQVLYAVR